MRANLCGQCKARPGGGILARMHICASLFLKISLFLVSTNDCDDDEAGGT